MNEDEKVEAALARVFAEVDGIDVDLVIAQGRRRRSRRRARGVALVGVAAASAVAMVVVGGSSGPHRAEQDPASGPTPYGEVETTGLVYDEPSRTAVNGGEPYVCPGLSASLTRGRYVSGGDHEVPLPGPSTIPVLCDGAITLVDWPGSDSTGGSVYRLQGEIVGDDLRVTAYTEVGDGDPREVDDVDYSTPCERPTGGWVGKLRAPWWTGIEGYSHRWVSYPADGRGAPPSDGSEPDWGSLVEIPTLAVSGDVEAARVRAEELAGGPVCVVQTSRPMSEAKKIAWRIKHRDGGRPRVEIADNHVDTVVELPVRFDDGALQRRYDVQYGTGWVDVIPAIYPVGQRSQR